MRTASVSRAAVLCALLVGCGPAAADEARMAPERAPAAVSELPDAVRYGTWLDAVEARRRAEVVERRARPAGTRWGRAAAALAARRLAERHETRLASRPRPSGGLVVGDSVALGAKPCLETLGYRVDAEVGRQFGTGLSRLRIQAMRGLPASVVVHLGTNGPFGAGDFESAMDLLGPDRRVVWVTIALPNAARYAFAEGLNAMIRDLTADHPNARLADFAAAAQAHPDWLAPDGIHIAGPGCAGFSATVDDAVTDPVGP